MQVFTWRRDSPAFTFSYAEALPLVFNTFYSPRKVKKYPPGKKSISTIPYMPFLSEVQKLFFLQSKAQRIFVTASASQSGLLLSSSGTGFFCPCFLCPLILHSPHVFLFSQSSNDTLVGWNFQWYKPLISGKPKWHFCHP